jgi:hypothetical protein
VHEKDIFPAAAGTLASMTTMETSAVLLLAEGTPSAVLLRAEGRENVQTGAVINDIPKDEKTIKPLAGIAETVENDTVTFTPVAEIQLLDNVMVALVIKPFTPSALKVSTSTPVAL